MGSKIITTGTGGASMTEIISKTAIDALLVIIAIAMMVKEDKFVALEERIAAKVKGLFKAD